MSPLVIDKHIIELILIFDVLVVIFLKVNVRPQEYLKEDAHSDI